MRKILLIIIILVCNGCSVLQYLSATYVNDFRKYQSKGFLITPSFSGFTYESIGEVRVKLTNPFASGEESDDCIKSMNKDESTKAVMRYFEIETYNVYDYATTRLVALAMEMGANAILNFQIQHITTLSDHAIEVSGFAVKLADK